MVSERNTGGERDVLLVGGPSGCGKSSFAYPFAAQSKLALTELDDLFITAASLTSPAALPDLHFFRSHPEATKTLTPEEILQAFVRLSGALAPAIEAVVTNHLETERPVLLEGDYLLPAVAARCRSLPGAEQAVRAVFLIEPDEAQIVANYAAREPELGRQAKRARVSWLYGQWLQAECARLDLPVVAARPWASLAKRVRAALA